MGNVGTMDELAKVALKVDSVAFIGLGAMGFGMASHLVKEGFTVRGYDVSCKSCQPCGQRVLLQYQLELPVLQVEQMSSGTECLDRLIYIYCLLTDPVL